MTPAIRTIWDLTPDLSIHIEAVHRLSNSGVVITHKGNGSSKDGFDAEWRAIDLLMVDDDVIKRCEVFDEADLDAALARFEELQPQARQLENAASQAYERMKACFAAHDWDALGNALAEDISTDDRRRVVNAGMRHGRDAAIQEWRTAADLGVTNMSSAVIATRGGHLILLGVQASGRDQRSGAVLSEVLGIVETNSDDRVAAYVSFDANDIDAALQELDARYLAGEAAPYAPVWQLGMDTIGELNRHEPGPMLGRFAYADHRRVPFASGEEFGRGVEELWTLVPDARYWTKAVHALDAHGCVVTLVIEGTDTHGSELQWGRIILFGSEEPRVEVYEEDDVDAALARFEELRPKSRRLENAASRADERLWGCFAARDWTRMAEAMAEDVVTVDRRRVVNGGVIRGRDLQIASLRASAEAGVETMTSTIIATRGEHLALTSVHGSFRGLDGADVISVVEIDADHRIAGGALFDPDELNAAFAELDARYLAGEAAAHRHTWSVIAGLYAGFNRHELPATTPDFTYIDHRPVITIDATDLPASIRAVWDLTPDISIYMETVHRLTDLGAVVTHTARGVSHEDFDAEWRMIDMFTVDGDLISRCEMFDEADLDAALARFDELHPQARRLENAASRVDGRLIAYFNAHDWDAMAETMAHDFSSEDRRHVVNAGLTQGREVAIANFRATAELGVTLDRSDVVATRGERLVLSRAQWSGPDRRPDAFHSEVLNVVEIDTDERIAAHVLFEADDFDAAFEQLDARYLAGEAAAHAHTWSVVAGAYAALNRHELPQTTPDWVDIDRRRLVKIEAGGMKDYLRAVFEATPRVSIQIKAVHRLSDFGAVVTHHSHATTPEGLDAEWQDINLVTINGDMVNRFELFDEADVDTALTRFEELQPQAPRLENTASQVGERFWKYFAAREWAAMADLIAGDIFSDDRRRVVNGGIRRGRDDHIADMRGIAEVLPDEIITPTVIATRGARLALTRICGLNRGLGPGEVTAELLSVVELDADNRIVSHIGFDLDDIDAAFEELDARYAVGEAAAYSQTWSLVTGRYAALNRHEFATPTTDSVDIDDHRRIAMVEPGDPTALLRAAWDLMPHFSIHIEAVHRLSALGAVVTRATNATSREGFAAEWRAIDSWTVEGDAIVRCELFDEADIDAALAKFDEVNRPALLENAATRIWSRLADAFNRRDLDGFLALTTADMRYEDRRRGLRDVVQGPARRKAVQAMFETPPSSFRMTLEPIAIRGSRLSLIRVCYRDTEYADRPIAVELLQITEVGHDGLMCDSASFDSDDIDTAFAELEARYLAGEAAAHSHTWSVIAGAYAGFNRHELPAMTTDSVYIDHRPLVTTEAVDLVASARTVWDLTPENRMYVEAVHRLSELGAVVSHVRKGTSQDGFVAEWRVIEIFTVDGDRLSRCEIFDEADLDAALAHFEDLHPQARRLENAASQVVARFWTCLATRDWVAMAEKMAGDFSSHDHRRVVNAGVLRGRDVNIANMRAVAEVGFEGLTSTVIATRGQRLVLTRIRSSAHGFEADEISADMLGMLEVGADNRFTASAIFDADDIDAAFEELDAWYLAGEAAAHAHTWSVIARECAAFNRHELPAAEWVTIDHRQLAVIDAREGQAAMRDIWEVTPNLSMRIEAVHRLSSAGAVSSYVASGTSPEGLDAEWPMILLLTLEGDRINRCEIFDEADLDAALTRFDELQPQARRLENAATLTDQRFWEYFAARDWAALASMLADDMINDDRRRIVNAGIRRGRDLEVANMRTLSDLGVTNITSTVIATRGERLLLRRTRFSLDQGPEDFHGDLLCIVELDAENRIATRVLFDPDEFDAAFEELDARYLEGEAAAYSHTWSLVNGRYAALNQHEIPSAASESIAIADHRRIAMVEPGDGSALLRAAWDLTPHFNIYIEAVHRLSALGAVVTRTTNATSREGFAAEWRAIDSWTIEGDEITRCDLFDEEDLDAALARFDELSPPTPLVDSAGD